MKLRKIPSYIFYVISAIFLVYAVWSFSRSAEIISEAIEAGQITVFGNLYEIVGFYMANTGQYFVFAFLLAGMGLLLQRSAFEKPIPTAANEETSAQDDESLDEWFSENREDEK